MSTNQSKQSAPSGATSAESKPNAASKSDDDIEDAQIVGEPPKRKRTDILRREVRVKPAKPATLIAYDLETTNIAVGTPRPLYITAYHQALGMDYESPIRDLKHLRLILETVFLIPEYEECKFVAWNANNFDAYFVAAALLTSNDWLMRPYMTSGKQVRGIRVFHAADIDADDAPSWEFVDGMAQLGLVGVSLEKFLNNFAPAYAKLKGNIDFSRESFNAANPLHTEYARRDSIGLYHAINYAQRILIERFNQPLRVTMGAVCIRIFAAHIPEGVRIVKPDEALTRIIREYAMRGGYCYCVRQYHGKVWKYDINQAYASAMREARLPAGFAHHHKTGIHFAASVFVVRIEAHNPRNRIPFYCRTYAGGKFSAVFALQHIDDTWITSIEFDQLKREGWQIKVIESHYWESHFSMRDYVNKLETGRQQAEGGPSGPIGTMYKNIGNHSYGKTVEQIEAVEYLLASEQPPGYVPHYVGDSDDPLEHVYYRGVDPIEKNYHQPQIGAFITSYVRMVIRRAALIDPGAWLYADTDCVVFSRDVTDKLDIHPSRYGAWKIEDAGIDYKLIAKKVYINTETDALHAKGLNIKRLTPADFDVWFDGTPPTQEQVQRNNFLSVMRGAEMYRSQTRRGTDPQREAKKAAKRAQKSAQQVARAMPLPKNSRVSSPVTK